MVSLTDQGWADQNEVAKAFGCSTRTLRRYQQRFEEGGLPALARLGGYPLGRARMRTSRRHWVQQLKTKGYSHGEIARRLGVSVRAIRKTLRRLGWKPIPVSQPELPLDSSAAANPSLPALIASTAPQQPSKPAGGDPNLSAFCSTPQEVAPSSHDTDPANRCADRLLARLGLLQDAPPLFGSAAAVPRAGVLLACRS